MYLYPRGTHRNVRYTSLLMSPGMDPESWLWDRSLEEIEIDKKS